MKVTDKRKKGVAHAWCAVTHGDIVVDANGKPWFKARLGSGVALDNGEHWTVAGMDEKGPFFSVKAELILTDYIPQF